MTNDSSSPQGQDTGERGSCEHDVSLCRNCNKTFDVGEPPILNVFCSMECHSAYVQQGFAEIKAIAALLYGYVFDDEGQP